MHAQSTDALCVWTLYALDDDLRGFVAPLLNVCDDEVHRTRDLLTSSNAEVFAAAGTSA
jgi:hypothetical protein